MVFTSSGCVIFIVIEVIEYYVDRLLAGILWWFLRFIQTAFPELGHMAFVDVFQSVDNIDQFANSLFDGAYFPECNVIFVGIEKDFIARIEIFLMGWETVFLNFACGGMNLWKTDLTFLANIVSAGERPIGVLGLGVILYTSGKL